MKSLRATFSLDDATTAAIRRLALSWRVSKSEVVRRAVHELDERRDRLSANERSRMLTVLDEWMAREPSRTREAAIAEVEDVRRARREAGRARP